MLLMCDPRISIFLSVEAKLIEIAPFVLTFKQITIHIKLNFEYSGMNESIGDRAGSRKHGVFPAWARKKALPLRIANELEPTQMFP